MTSAPTIRSRPWYERLAPFLLIGGILVAYHATWDVPFLFDDSSILDTAELHELSWRTVRGTSRPLVQLSFALNWAVARNHVVGYHVVNLVVHALAALTLYGIVARTVGTPGFALATALAWALHPLQTESVTYVVQRAESLMGLCYLATLYAVIRGARSTRATPWYAAAVVACALGMLCKPVMVTAPIVVLLYDRVFLAGSGARAWRERRALYIGLFATWAILALLLAGHAHEPAATFGFAIQDLTFGEFVRSQPGVILRYLWLVAWPYGLVLDYGWPPASGFAGVVVPTVVLIGGIAASLYALRTRRKLRFLVVAFVITLAPTSSIVPIRDLAFEHRMYLPLAPLVTLLVAGGWALVRYAHLPPAAGRRAAAVAAAAVVAALMLLTVVRNHDYRSPLAMWMDVVAKRPGNARAHANLAHAWLEDNHLAEGIAAGEEAVRLDPNQTDAHIHLSHAYTILGQYRGAEAHAAEASRLTPTSSEAQNNWGAALGHQNRFAEAEPHYREALHLRPAYPEAKNNLGIALMQLGRLDEAAALYREAVRDRPDYAEPYSNLGNLLLRQNKPAEALEQYRRAVGLKPESGEVHLNLALALVALGRRSEALAEAADALRLRPELASLVRQAGLGGG